MGWDRVGIKYGQIVGPYTGNCLLFILYYNNIIVLCEMKTIYQFIFSSCTFVNKMFIYSGFKRGIRGWKWRRKCSREDLLSDKLIIILLLCLLFKRDICNHILN